MLIFGLFIPSGFISKDISVHMKNEIAWDEPEKLECLLNGPLSLAEESMLVFTSPQ